MRLSLPALARAVKTLPRGRFRDLQRLAEAARRDAGRSWSRKTAAVLDVCARNEPAAASTWDAVRLFAQLPPSRPDVQALLPLLQRQAGSAPPAVLAVGDLALTQGLLPELRPEFRDAYMRCMSRENPYKAVQIWKQLPAPLKSSTTGAQLYLAAARPTKAESLLAGGLAVSASLVRLFVEHYARAQDARGVQKWVDRWQAPAPADVNWLHHLVGTDPALRSVRLPQPLDRSTLFPARRAIGKRLQNLVSAVNGLLAAAPALFDAAQVRAKWRSSINDPTRATLEALAREIACADARAARDWTHVLKLVSFDTGLEICRHVPDLPPRAYAALLSRATSEAGVEKVIDLMSREPDVLYTRECLSALAQRSPAIFLELALPEEVHGTVLTQHHLAALWRARPDVDVQKWLLLLTRANAASVGLLRSACIELLRQQKLTDVSRLLYDFVVVQRLRLDDRVLDVLAQARRGRAVSLQKLSKPMGHGLAEHEALIEYEKAARRLDLPLLGSE